MRTGKAERLAEVPRWPEGDEGVLEAGEERCQTGRSSKKGETCKSREKKAQKEDAE